MSRTNQDAIDDLMTRAGMMPVANADLLESWSLTYTPEGIPVYVSPEPPIAAAYTRSYADPLVDDVPLFFHGPTGGHNLYETDLDEDAIAEQAFLRSFGISTWLTRMNRRFPVRVTF